MQYKQFLQELKQIETNSVSQIPDILTPPPTMRINETTLKKIKTKNFINQKMYKKYLKIKNSM